MYTTLINGHHQIVFSDEEKAEIYDLYVNKGYSMRALTRKFGCSIKPMTRLLSEMNLDHSRGNLTSFKYNYPYGLYNQAVEREVLESIAKLHSKKQKYDINDRYFDDIYSPEVIYTIGFLYADGCNCNLTSVSMNLEEQDGYILDVMNRNMQNQCQVKFVDMSNKHDFGYTYKNQYSMNIYNKRIAHVLNILGVTPKKSLTLEFPKWLHPNLYSHFIRGVFDGDGSIHRYIRPTSIPQYNLTITSTNDFCKALVDISAKYVGIKAHIYDASNHNGITKVFTISGPMVVRAFMDWMYNDATIFLRRKYNRYCGYFNISNSLVA